MFGELAVFDAYFVNPGSGTAMRDYVVISDGKKGTPACFRRYCPSGARSRKVIRVEDST
jgi:hypothetical protein